MGNFVDLTKRKFGRLAVLERVPNCADGHAKWKCVCDCGNIVTVSGVSLRMGSTQSCGCYKTERNTSHGKSNSHEYRIWAHMLQRCSNKKAKSYKDYGGRGITVCRGWHKFSNFYEDMKDCPEGLTLERINNNLGYCKENCKWATRTEQQRNQRVRKTSLTGVAGVSFYSRDKNWRASIVVNGKCIHLGYFAEITDAIKARKAGEAKYW